MMTSISFMTSFHCCLEINPINRRRFLNKINRHRSAPMRYDCRRSSLVEKLGGSSRASKIAAPCTHCSAGVDLLGVRRSDFARQRNQATQAGVRQRIEWPSEGRPLRQTWRRETPTTGSARQSRNLSQMRKWIGRFLPDRLVQASASCASRRDEAGQRLSRAAAGELKASKRRVARSRTPIPRPTGRR